MSHTDIDKGTLLHLLDESQRFLRAAGFPLSESTDIQ